MKISVIIPIKNGEATLVKCLESIRQQTIGEQIEIIVLDSISTDKSRQIAETFSARIIDVPKGSFNHGLTRNLGARYAIGEFIYFTTQDAYLAEKNQLEKMSAHFNDLELQAVVGMQAIPNDLDKNPAGWFKRITQPVTAISHFPNREFDNLTVKEQLQKTTNWDDVNAMYRRSILITVPFTKTQFAEDKLWAKDALLAGYKIAFDPSLVVYHYHHRDFKYSFTVGYTVNYHYYKFFGVLPALPAFFIPLLTSWYRILKNSKITVWKKCYWSFHNFTALTGDYLSSFIFLIIQKLFSEKVMEKSFKLFCGQVPQGKLKG